MSLTRSESIQPSFPWPVRNLATILGGLAAGVALLFGTLALFTVPSPSEGNAREVHGALVAFGGIPSQGDDLGILLEDGSRFYINRAAEVTSLDVDRLLAEVQPGDSVTLTTVQPLAWRLLGRARSAPIPVAGVRTADTVYMDPAVAAETWGSQARFSRLALVSLAVAGVCALGLGVDWKGGV